MKITAILPKVSDFSDLRSLRASLEQNAVAPAPAGPAEPLPSLDLRPQGDWAREFIHQKTGNNLVT